MYKLKNKTLWLKIFLRFFWNVSRVYMGSGSKGCLMYYHVTSFGSVIVYTYVMIIDLKIKF